MTSEAHLYITSIKQPWFFEHCMILFFLAPVFEYRGGWLAEFGMVAGC